LRRDPPPVGIVRIDHDRDIVAAERFDPVDRGDGGAGGAP
jgi:hypothetical protein